MPLRPQLPIAISRRTMPAELLYLHDCRSGKCVTLSTSPTFPLLFSGIIQFTDVENSVRHPGEADLLESQCDRKQHFDHNFDIVKSYQLCHNCTLFGYGFAFKDWCWGPCCDWNGVSGIVMRLRSNDRRCGEFIKKNDSP